MTSRLITTFDGSAAELESLLLSRGMPEAQVIGHRRRDQLFLVEVTPAPGARWLDLFVEELKALRDHAIEASLDCPLVSMAIKTVGRGSPLDGQTSSEPGVEIAVLDPNPIFAHRRSFKAGLKTFVLTEGGWREEATRRPLDSDQASRIASVATQVSPASPIRGYWCRWVWDMMMALDHVVDTSEVKVVVFACVLGSKPHGVVQDKLGETFDRAREHGITCIAAAGNSGPFGGISEPANFASVITVGGAAGRCPGTPTSNAVDHVVAEPSSRGSRHGLKPNFLLPYHGHEYVLEEGYGRGEGTSLSAARAAGLAARLIAKRQERGTGFSPEDVKKHFVTSCTRIKDEPDSRTEAPAFAQGAGLLVESRFLEAIEPSGATAQA